MKVLVPPIKSQGIKTKLVPWIMGLKPEFSGRWIEPFLGTGVVAFNSGCERAVLNDANPHLINFYKAVQAGAIDSPGTRAFLEEEGARLREGGHAHYNLVRDRFNESFRPLDFLFLSRAGFNGMIRFSSKGRWNIPFCKKPGRFSKSYVTKIANQIRACETAMRPEWEFRHGDFEEAIGMAGAADFIYCDPPYFGRHAGYYSGWIEEDELRLHRALKGTKARFILSTWHHNAFRENAMIGRLWKDFNVVTRDHFYHNGARAGNRKAMVEALVFNFDAAADR